MKSLEHCLACEADGPRDVPLPGNPTGAGWLATFIQSLRDIAVSPRRSFAVSPYSRFPKPEEPELVPTANSGSVVPSGAGFISKIRLYKSSP